MGKIRGHAAEHLAQARMVIVPDNDEILDDMAMLKKENAQRVVAIRVPATPDSAKRVLWLSTHGAEVINLVFDRHGRERAETNPRHMRDNIREAHQALVKEKIRDEVT